MKGDSGLNPKKKFFDYFLWKRTNRLNLKMGSNLNKKQRRIIEINSKQKGLLNLENISKGDILDIDGKKELIIKMSKRNRSNTFKGKITTLRRNDPHWLKESDYEIFGETKYFSISDLLQEDGGGVLHNTKSSSYNKLDKKLVRAEL